MNLFKKIIGQVLFPRAVKFSDDLKNSFLSSVEETSKFDSSIKHLAQTWLAVGPYTYFLELFIEKENWNSPFAKAFLRSELIDAQGCYQITQAFYLRNLFRILENDKEYKKFSKDTIINDVISNMRFGKNIIELSNDLENLIKDLPMIENHSMSYVKKIFQKQYTDEDKLEKLIGSFWTMSDSLFSLTVFTTESLKKVKYIDSQKT